MKTSLVSLSLLLVAGLGEASECCQCETQVVNRCIDSNNAQQLTDRLPIREEESLRNYLDRLLSRHSADKTRSLQKAKPATVGTDGGFGSRVGSSLTNFTSLLGLSVDAISPNKEDQTVTIDLNKLFGLRSDFKISTILREPVLDSKLVRTIVDSEQERQSDSLLDELGDTDDIAISFSYGINRKALVNKTPTRIQLGIGRNPTLYTEVIAELYLQASNTDQALLEGIDYRIPLLENCEYSQLYSQTVIDLHKTCGNGTWSREEVKTQVSTSIAQLAIDIAPDMQARALASGTLNKLPELVDSQPQFVLESAWRWRDDLVGSDEWSASAKYEWGLQNINSVLKKSKKKSIGLLEAFKDISINNKEKDNRFAVSLTYVQRSARDISYSYDQVTVDPATGAENSFPKVATLTAESADEWCGKLTWGRALTAQTIDVGGEQVHPRIDLTAEYVWVDDDPSRQKRWVGELTYTVPLKGGVTLPISLDYATKPEFLGDVDQRFGAKVGLSYSLKKSDSN